MKEIELPRDIKSLEIHLLNGSLKNKIIKVCSDTGTELRNNIIFDNCHFIFYHNSTLSFNANRPDEVCDTDYIDCSFENVDKVWYGGRLIAC